MIGWFVLAIVVILCIGITIYRIKYYKKLAIISFKDTLALTELPIVTLFHNKEKFNFLIDTGSTYSYINPKDINRCQGKKTGSMASYTDCNGKNSVASVYKCIFNLDKNVFNFEFNTADLPGVYEGIKEQYGANVHGVIGSDFLNEYNYIIDFEKLIAYSKK